MKHLGSERGQRAKELLNGHLLATPGTCWGLSLPPDKPWDSTAKQEGISSIRNFLVLLRVLSASEQLQGVEPVHGALPGDG